MKKLILTLLLGGLMMTGLSAKTAFVYFSATGTTERMAKNAAEAMGADLFEIQPVHKYTDADLDWHNKKSLSSSECNDPKSRPAIKSVVSTSSNKTFDISSYDTVRFFYILLSFFKISKFRRFDIILSKCSAFYSCTCTALIKKVNGLVRKESVIDISL